MATIATLVMVVMDTVTMVDTVMVAMSLMLDQATPLDHTTQATTPSILISFILIL